MSFELTGTVHVAPSADQLYDDLAGLLMARSMGAAENRSVFHLALSGGSTPEPFYMRLVTDPRFRAIPWEKTHLWIVDERRVPDDDKRCNYRMICESLIDHVPLRARRCHPMPVLAADPAAAYEADLRRLVSPIAPVPRLDFVLLGMGDDAHTASLFPNSPAVQERQQLVAVNEGPAVTPPDRLTMTFPLINAARWIAVLVTGVGKNPTLRRVEKQLQDGGPDPKAFPITGIEPVSPDGKLTWYLDAEAAG